jgi:hypothetical protein
MIIETCPKCGHDLTNFILASNPPIPQKICHACGWSWTGKPEEVVRIPFGGNRLEVDGYPPLNDFINEITEKEIQEYLSSTYYKKMIKENEYD